MSASERRLADLVSENARLRELLRRQMMAGEELEVTAIVGSDGVPKVDLRWDRLAAQLSPQEARDLAVRMVEVSCWADQDALAFNALKGRFGEGEAAGFLAMLREERGGDRNRSG